MRSLRSERGKPKVEEASIATRGVMPSFLAVAAARMAMSASCSEFGNSVTEVSATSTIRPREKIT